MFVFRIIIGSGSAENQALGSCGSSDYESWGGHQGRLNWSC